MKGRIAIGLLIALLALAHSFGAEADDLKERIVAQSRTVTTEDYAYTRTVRMETIGKAEPEERVVVERWDPTLSEDKRWTLVSINGKPPTPADLKSYRKDVAKRRQTYYGRIAEYFAKPATTGTDARGATVFRFASLPKETVMVSDTDISADSTGELVVDASGAMPFVEEVRFVLTKPTRLKLIAKVERFEMKTRYRLLANGKPVPSELVSEISGSMLGKQGLIKTRIVYTDYRPTGR